MFDPTGFIVCARYLQQGAIYSFVGLKYDEARLRSAINRAYVAAYCAARNHLLDKGKLARNSASYTNVQTTFLFNADKRHQKIAIALEKLRRNQLAADYDRAPRPPLVGTTYWLLNSADDILTTLPSL
jgi:uncharacterized protein (UPF0332 family)